MNEGELANQVRNYLTLRRNSLWMWGDRGSVLLWYDGRLACFREELAAVVVRLAPHGLPSLSAIALLLTATSDRWEGTHEGIADLLDSSSPFVERIGKEALDGLQRVRMLPRPLRATLHAKAVLAEIVFEGTRPKIVPATSERIADELAQSPLAEEYLNRTDASTTNQSMKHLELLDAFRELCEGLRRIQPDRVEQRMKTGLDWLPNAIDPGKIPSCEAARRLVDQLKKDSQFVGFARVTQQMLASTLLPRRLELAQDWAVGGVDDITNRGPLDRLLLSELANDDLALVARLALDEALYLRRELPPARPRQHRRVVLDAGIRAWGVPRILITALALGLVGNADPRDEVSAERSDGKTGHPIDFGSLEGLRAHLSEVDTHIDSTSFFSCLADDILPDTELIVVSTRDAAKDPSWQAAVAKVRVDRLYVALVDREGDCELVERTSHGRKVLRKWKCDPNDLQSSANEPATPVIDGGSAPRSLPAILSARPFPFRLGPAVDWRSVWQVDNVGFLQAASDGRVLLWNSDGRGAIELSHSLPQGRYQLLWYSTNESPEHWAILGTVLSGKKSRVRRAYALKVNPIEFTCEIHSLSLPANILGFFDVNGVAMAWGEDRVIYMVETMPPRIKPVGLLPHRTTKLCGRFAEAEARWHAVHYDGYTAKWELMEALTRKEFPSNDCVGVLESQGIEGPCFISRNGTIFYGEKGVTRLAAMRRGWVEKVEPLQPNGRSYAIHVVGSDAGYRAVLVLSELGAEAGNDAAPLTYKVVVSSSRESYFAAKWGGRMRQRSVLSRFTRVAIAENGSLLLETNGEKSRVLFTGTGRHRLRLQLVRAGTTSGDQARTIDDARKRSRPFVALSNNDPHSRLALRMAQWENGSRAYLDGRGLLHLCSSDPGIPEISLVLTDGELAVWTEDGYLRGPTYFTGEPRTEGDVGFVESRLRAFAERL